MFSDIKDSLGNSLIGTIISESIDDAEIVFDKVYKVNVESGNYLKLSKVELSDKYITKSSFNDFISSIKKDGFSITEVKDSNGNIINENYFDPLENQNEAYINSQERKIKPPQGESNSNNVTTDTDNFMADNKVYKKNIPIQLDYTYINKDITEQNKIEDIILKDIPWNKSDETYLSDEDVWQVSYFFDI